MRLPTVPLPSATKPLSKSKSGGIFNYLTAIALLAMTACLCLLVIGNAAAPNVPSSNIRHTHTPLELQPAEPFEPKISGTSKSAYREQNNDKVRRLTESAVISEFNAWVERYFHDSFGSDKDQIERGRALSQKRRELFKELIRLAPEAALERAIPEEKHKRLPVSVSQNLERWVGAYGDLLVSVVDEVDHRTGEMTGSRIEREVVIGDYKFTALVYGRRLAMTTKLNIPLRGIILNGMMAVDESPLRKLKPAEYKSREVDAAKLGQFGVAAEVGGEIVYFTNEGELFRFLREQIAWEAKVGPIRPGGKQQLLSPWTEGAKTVLFIRVDFSDQPGEPMDGSGPLTQTRALTVMDTQVDPFYVNSSYNKTSLQTTVTSVVRLPQTKSFYEQGNNWLTLLTDARNAAREAGFETNNFNLDIVAFSSIQGSFAAAGRGFLGAKGVWLNGSFSAGLIAHELGHNYGLHHANSWLTTDGTVIGQGIDVEYGDSFDTMGFTGASEFHFNARYKRSLDWLTDVNVQTVTNDGIYRVFAQDSVTPGGIRVLKIRKDELKDYWVEFRQLFTNNPNAMNGAIIRWDYLSEGLRRTQLLDMAPTTSGFTFDAPLLVGQSFNDDQNRIRMTVVGKGNTTPESIDVRVELNVGCTFNLGQTSQNFLPNGGEGSIPVNTQSGCRPPATSNATWLSPVQGDTSTVRYIVAANYDSQPRTGTITVAGQTFAVEQSAATTACVPRPAGMVAWWRGEGNAQDQTGVNNGTLVSNMTFGGGKVGGGFLGNYSNGAGVVKVPDSPSLALTQSMTFEGWLKFGSYAGTVIERRTTGFPSLGSYEVWMLSNGQLLFTVWYEGGGGVGVSSDAVPLNEFFHFAASLDDSTGRIRMYINGSLDREFTITQRPNTLSGAPVTVGNINGITDELSVYDRALSESEIQAIYNAGIAATGATGKCLESSIQVNVQSNPTGREFTVDGITYNTAQIFNWIPGSNHTIGTTAIQSGGTDTQYVWSDWSDGLAISHSVAPTVATTYTANFTTQHMLTMNAGVGGTVSPVSGFYNSNQSLQIAATPNSGYSFGSWTGNGTGSFTGTTNPVNVTMNGPITQTATFSQNPVEVVIQTNPAGLSVSIDGGAAAIAPQTRVWAPGSSHTISTTSPQAGAAGTQYVWSNWSDGGAISHTVTASGSVNSYTANFTTQFQLTMSAGTGGTVSPSSGFFNSGQTVEITATPNSGFLFSGWIGTGTGSYTGSNNPVIVTVNGPVTQAASFVSGLQLVLEDQGPVPGQVLALDSTLWVRDPFVVFGPLNWLYPAPDPNTRLMIFLMNFQPIAGESASAVVVNIVGSNNQSFDVPAEDVRPLAGTPMFQVVFRLPDGLATGTCTIKVRAHNETTNPGTLRIRL